MLVKRVEIGRLDFPERDALKSTHCFLIHGSSVSSCGAPLSWPGRALSSCCACATAFSISTILPLDDPFEHARQGPGFHQQPKVLVKALTRPGERSLGDTFLQDSHFVAVLTKKGMLPEFLRSIDRNRHGHHRPGDAAQKATVSLILQQELDPAFPVLRIFPLKEHQGVGERVPPNLFPPRWVCRRQLIADGRILLLKLRDRIQGSQG